MKKRSNDRTARIDHEGGLSRRQFLAGSAGAVATGLLAARFGAAAPAFAHDGGDHAAPSLHIWAATRDGDRYLALTAEGTRPDIVELEVDANGAVRLGSSTGAALPEDFAPVALLATGGRLLVAGAAVREQDPVALDDGPDALLPGDRGGVPTDDGFHDRAVLVPDYVARPSLLEVTRDGARALPLEEQAPAGFGVATGIVSLPDGRLGVAIEGAGEPEQAYNDVTRVAESADREGLTWTFDVVDAGLGEGEKSHLVAADGRLFAATVDRDGDRGFFQRPLRHGAAWSRLATDGGEGPLLAAVARGGAVEVVSPTHEGAARLRNEPGRPGWQQVSAVTIPGDRVLDVVAVAGSRGELVALGRSDARLVS